MIIYVNKNMFVCVFFKKYSLVLFVEFFFVFIKLSFSFLSFFLVNIFRF